MSHVPVKQALEGKHLAPYTAWGRGYNFGTSTTNQHHQNALLSGGLLGGVAGLAAEAMRKKTDEEKNQSLLRKALRYAAMGGAGAAGGAGVGGALGAMTAPGMLRVHNSVAAKLPPELLSGKLEAQILDSMNKKSGAQAAEKQSFMGLGGVAGMATAPSKEEEDLSIGRGALRGVGTALGVVPGAVTGGLAGGLGAAGIGAILGAVLRTDPQLSQRMGHGAGTLAPLGMLAGGLGGAVYGGYKGNKATKALLDKTAPISEKKKEDSDVDEKLAGFGQLVGSGLRSVAASPAAHAVGAGLAHAGVAGGIGAGIGAATAKPGQRWEGAQRGLVRGVGTSAGMQAGGALGMGASRAAGSGVGGQLAGILAGSAIGGTAGNLATGKLLGPAKTQTAAAPQTQPVKTAFNSIAGGPSTPGAAMTTVSNAGRPYVGPTSSNPFGTNNPQKMPWQQTANGLRRQLSPAETAAFESQNSPSAGVRLGAQPAGGAQGDAKAGYKQMAQQGQFNEMAQQAQQQHGVAVDPAKLQQQWQQHFDKYGPAGQKPGYLG